ncbi:hypothetical protein [Streptomyces sp. CS014]|uniref:hypothetical protein n=1 Tax=Streptomyces sp. CS014 TaxID=2162707 RepID=UPI000D5248A9|nr:hypothetical protein [Streptomyces sp. CS014]PVC81551.1 hypothetical protein DBP12_36650 [Streptomyces sp. CS014]
MSRKRPGRVRTKRDNRREPLLLSTIPPSNINVREGEIMTIVCPDCETWRRLMGESQLKIREHCPRGCTVRAAECEAHPRCPGSNQAVRLDISVEQWGEAMLAADSTATGRRSARQHFKPIPAPAKPVMQMSPIPTTSGEALAAYRSHLRPCRSSTSATPCLGTHRCSEGARLAALYAELKQTQGQRDSEARVDALLTRSRRARAWTRHAEATSGSNMVLAKRSGTAIEEANNSVRARSASAVSEFRGPDVPLDPLKISA